MKKVFVFLVVLSIAAVSFADNCPIAKFYKVDSGIHRGAAPGEKGMQHLKDKGIKAIIDLRTGKASVLKEKRLAEKLAIRYINIPLNPIYGLPEQKQVEMFLKITKDPKNRPVFIHCHNGVHRTGRMVAVYLKDALE